MPGPEAQLSRFSLSDNELGPGFDAISVPMQGFCFSPVAQRFTGGDPSVLLLLDRSL